MPFYKVSFPEVLYNRSEKQILVGSIQRETPVAIAHIRSNATWVLESHQFVDGTYRY
jgi:hypothetical protein